MFQVAKKTAQKSKTLLTDIERWQKVHNNFHSFPFSSQISLWLAVQSILSFLFEMQGVASTDGKVSSLLIIILLAYEYFCVPHFFWEGGMDGLCWYPTTPKFLLFNSSSPLFYWIFFSSFRNKERCSSRCLLYLITLLYHFYTMSMSCRNQFNSYKYGMSHMIICFLKSLRRHFFLAIVTYLGLSSVWSPHRYPCAEAAIN